VHILPDKPVQTCSKFRDCWSLLTELYHVTSSIGADIFRAFVIAFDGVSLTIANKNLTNIRCLCEEFGYEKLSEIVSEFLGQYSSHGERVCRQRVALNALNALNAALAAQVAALTTWVADLTTDNPREIALLQPLRLSYSAPTDFLRRR
jgi:hypothetical protein